MKREQYHRAADASKRQILSKSVIKRLTAQTAGAPVFSEQANRWLAEGQSRKRNPFRPWTVRTYSSQIENHLKPLIGQIPVQAIGNAVVKDVASQLATKGFSATTIELNINIIKQIRASILDQEGAQVYPYTWNSDFIDAPIVDKDKQKTPIASAQAVGDALSKNCRGIGALVALLTGSGLRIAEALALRIGVPDDGKGTVWIPQENRVIVRNQRNGKTFGPVKTKAGNREIDLAEPLNNYLKKMVQPGPSIIFPLSEGRYRKALVKCGIIGGFHSLRRFRVTHLRMNNVPDSLIHFWIGHEDESVTDRYTKVGSEIEARKIQTNRVGLGFKLPEAS